MPSATEAIAAKLAAKNNKAKPQATPEPEAEDEDETDGLEDIDESGDIEGTEGDDLDVDVKAVEEATNEALASGMSVKDRAAAARAARKGGKAAPADEPTPIESAPSKRAAKNAPAAKATKATGSPKQIAAREAFAAKSRERAAAKAAEREAAAEAEAPTPVQTQEQVKQSQAAKRKAAQEARAAESKPRSAPTSKATKVAAPAATKAAAKVKPGPVQAKLKAEKAKKPANDSKAKVHALLAKGKTRQEIMAELNLSYAAVFHHAKSYEGDIKSTRGRVFVETPWDEEGGKLRKGREETVSRSEAMRRDFRFGKMEVGDIGRKYDVAYQIAYTAVRSLMDRDDDE